MEDDFEELQPEMLTTVATASYAMAGMAYLVLAALLLTSWRGRLHGMMLLVACLLSVLWAAFFAYQANQNAPLSLSSDVLEILRNAGWTGFLIVLLGLHQQEKNSSGTRTSPALTAIALLYTGCLFVTAYSHGKDDHTFHATADFTSNIVGSLAMAILGMILVEQVYRNTPLRQRWGIKFACLGIGGIFAYDFYLYSLTLLRGWTSTTKPSNFRC